MVDEDCPKGDGAIAPNGEGADVVVEESPKEVLPAVPEDAPKGFGAVLEPLPPEVNGPEEVCCWLPRNGFEAGVGIEDVVVVPCPKPLIADALEAPEL